MTPHALLPNRDTMYQAFVEKDPSFEGLFVMGVRTTGIFCRPTCPARKPKPENVEFFPRCGDALAAGYRPCKRCQPLQAKGTTPDWLKPLLAAVDADPSRRWTSQDVRDFGIEPARVRRWFQAEHGMTFLAYLRSRRLGEAFSRIKSGSDILEAAATADYDSVSGFCDALRKRSGTSATKSKERLQLRVHQVASPLGPIMVAGTEEMVYLVEFWDRRMLETQFTVLEKRLNAVFFPGETNATRELAKELELYFSGKLTVFKTPIQFPGTEHQKQVWQGLLDVPTGTTWTYRQLAAHIGKPSAVRSVARAVGENRFAIVIPCHRIVGSDGNLTGYGGGLWRKRFLLGHETKNLGATRSRQAS